MSKFSLNLTWWKKLLLAIMPPFLAGFLGSWFVAGKVQTWYFQLQKPFFAPPSWLFGPVWTLLYLMMAGATYWILSHTHHPWRQKAYLVYLGQIILNGLWTPIFFDWGQLWLAFIELLILLGLVIYQTWLYFKIEKATVWLLLPYILWLSFAGILNLSLAFLN